jgi:hypothetical protein
VGISNNAKYFSSSIHSAELSRANISNILFFCRLKNVIIIISAKIKIKKIALYE